VIDGDADGIGEYGGFGDLGGVTLSAHFKAVRDGCCERNGYRFRIFLPGRYGPVAESAPGGFDARDVDPDRAERMWCAYAWPVKPGMRTFFVSHAGDILTIETGYAGDHRPDALAAYRPGQVELDGAIAMDARGGDGNVWRIGG
jgi:hypothetical protein